MASVAVVLVMLGVAVCAAWGAKIESIEESVGNLEDEMMTGASGMTQKEFEKELKNSRTDIDKYLRKNPSDVQALLLSVRVAVIEQILEPVMLSPADDEKMEDPYTDQHALLDRALAIDPESAAAHYWKARLYGLEVPSVSDAGMFIMEAVDLPSAIEHAGTAVELAPTDVSYREALALYLVDAERREEAAEVMSMEEAAGTLIATLLADMRTVPVPDRALYSRTDSRWFADMNRGGVENYPQLRVKAFALPATPQDVEAFYAGSWEGFALLRRDPSDRGGVQFLKFMDQGLEPVADLEEFQERAAEGHGIVLIVRDIPEPTEDDLRTTIAGEELPEGFGPSICYLYLLAVRPTEQ
jgi:hypothetical protein